jgi:hypothetical protein
MIGNAPAEVKTACRRRTDAYGTVCRRVPAAGSSVVPFVAIVCGLVLILLGSDGYADVIGLVRPTDLHTPTSLIPAYFGGVLVLCGLVALNERALKHAMHLAAMVGLIGLIAGAAMGLPKAFSGNMERPAAVRSQLWLAGVCLVFVLLCVNSFVQARRRRKAAPQ